jgi:hypothetical protein
MKGIVRKAGLWALPRAETSDEYDSVKTHEAMRHDDYDLNQAHLDGLKSTPNNALLKINHHWNS